MTTVAAEEVPRERGWRLVVIAALCVLLIPLTPMLRVILPVEQTFVLVVPALAAFACVGFVMGGRLPLALLWSALAAWVLWQFTAAGATYALLTAGWSLLLAAVFGVSVLMRKDQPAQPFLQYAVSSIALTLAVGGMAVSASPNGIGAVRQAIEVEVGHRAETSLSGWKQMTEKQEWRDFVVDNPDAKTLSQQVETQLQAAPSVALTLFPALLALESLAALALAWALYHRIGRARLGPPLAPLRDFRFNDQFIWGLIAGLVMLVVPGFASMSAVGANLLVFFGVIYALRGFGIVVWFLAPGRIMTVLLIGFAVVFLSVSGVLALGLGLGDTWADWRSRVKPKT
jgi:hypothetical protein